MFLKLSKLILKIAKPPFTLCRHRVKERLIREPEFIHSFVQSTSCEVQREWSHAWKLIFLHCKNICRGVSQCMIQQNLTPSVHHQLLTSAQQRRNGCLVWSLIEQWSCSLCQGCMLDWSWKGLPTAQRESPGYTSLFVRYPTRFSAVSSIKTNNR